MRKIRSRFSHVLNVALGPVPRSKANLIVGEKGRKGQGANCSINKAKALSVVVAFLRSALVVSAFLFSAESAIHFQPGATPQGFIFNGP